jgi:hypothetical protein
MNRDYLSHTSDMRAPIFYDSNDVNYYIDPNSTSRFYQARVPYRIHIGDETNLYNGVLQETRRPDLTIKGQYPQLNLMSSEINNSNHGPTLRFTAYDSANASSGNLKHWVIGIPGTNATMLSFGYRQNPPSNNPHYGIGRGWSSGDDVAIMWIQNNRHVYVENNLYAGAFYDRNDSTFFLNPNSGGTLKGSNGSLAIRGSWPQLRIAQDDGTADASINFDAGSGYRKWNVGPGAGTSEGDEFGFAVYSGTRGTHYGTNLRINAISGNVQIGDRDNPAEKLDVNGNALFRGTLYMNNDQQIQLRTSSGNVRGYIRATESNDAHLVIATSGGEDIAFRDGGTGGGTNMIIRGDGDVFTTRNHYGSGAYFNAYYDRDDTAYRADPRSNSIFNTADFNGRVRFLGRTTDSAGSSGYITSGQLDDYMNNVAMELHSGNDAPVTIYFKSNVNAPSDFAYITYDPDYNNSGENGALVLGSENDGTGSSDYIRLQARTVVDSNAYSSDNTTIMEWMYRGSQYGVFNTDYFRHNSDIRTPIFYDSNDTSVRWDGNYMVLRGSSPTLYLRDTNHRSAMVHVNSNIFYVLRGSGNDSESWSTYNGYWPMELNLSNNDATFGRNLTAIGSIYTERYYDRNDGNYYGDFASTSYMNDVRVNILYDRNNTAYYVHNNDGDFVLRNGSVSTLDVSRINVDGYQFAETRSRGVSAGNWYTIAEVSSGRAYATFHVWDSNSGRHGSMKFTAGISYGGVGTITMLGKSWYSGGGIFNNIRIRRTSTYDRMYLQIYVTSSGTLYSAITEAFSGGNRWNLTDGPTGNPGSTTDTEIGDVNSYRGLYTSAQIGAEEEIYSRRQMRAPIFVDSDDTNYFVDPRSTSQLRYVLANDWFRAQSDTGFYFQDYGYGMRSVHSEGGEYGSVATYGGLRWEGYSIDGRYVFMASGDEVGIYQDVNNEWMLYGVRNSYMELRYNNSRKGRAESWGWRVDGDMRATGDVIAYYSDMRLKDKVGDIESALDKVGKLNGFYYRNNKEANLLGYEGNDLQVGLSAQDVESVLPEIVHPAPLAESLGYDYKTINYDRVVPLLVNAINEQKAIVDEQKEEIEYLKSELSEMKEMLKQILNKG